MNATHSVPTAPLVPSSHLRDLRVLVVDDNQTQRRVLADWLREWHMQPTVLGNAADAMDALEDASAAAQPYTLLVLDSRMPGTDGWALAAQIRTRAAFSALHIVMLDSTDRPGDPARLRELGIERHLLKPVLQEELFEAIHQAEGATETGAPTPAKSVWTSGSTSPGAITSMRILLAEDNEFSAQFMVQLLTGRGHVVELAEDGRAALELACEDRFDLLLLDLHMPELDGFDVARAIRQRETSAGGRLTIVATARSRKEDRDCCLAVGIDDFLTKPVRPADLMAAVDRLVVAPADSRPEARPGHLLDAVAVLRACGDDEEALATLSRGLQTHLPVRVTEVKDAIAAGDSPRAREAAHKLCALLFAFSTAAGDVASRLEDLAADGRLDECGPLMEQLDEMSGILLRKADHLSIDALRREAGTRNDRGGHRP